MFLSNLRKSFLSLGLCVIILQGCGSTSTSETVPVAAPVETTSEFPFSTKEPEVYQGDIVINGREADRTFVARKADLWREDQYRDGSLWLSELFTDKRYSIDHTRKIYVEEGPSENGVESFTDSPLHVFRGKEFYQFDEIGREGTTVRYKVRTNKYMPDEILIDVDTASGMIVRQEFRSPGESPEQASYVYELRNLKIGVDGSIFALPSSYRKVTSAEFNTKSDK